MATPVIASSESGVPNTRAAPYFSTSPRVVPWMAFGSSTSRPKRMTEASRSISWSVASRMASTYDNGRSDFAVLAADLLALAVAPARSSDACLSRQRVVSMSGGLLECCESRGGMKDVGRQLANRWEWAGFGEGDCLVNLCLHFSLNLVPRSG